MPKSSRLKKVKPSKKKKRAKKKKKRGVMRQRRSVLDVSTWILGPFKRQNWDLQLCSNKGQIIENLNSSKTLGSRTLRFNFHAIQKNQSFTKVKGTYKTYRQDPEILKFSDTAELIRNRGGERQKNRSSGCAQNKLWFRTSGNGQRTVRTCSMLFFTVV